jgi:hypothetical protein
MKKELGIKSKKDDMSKTELMDVTLAELLSARKIETEKVMGYKNVNPVCLESSKKIKELVSEKKVITDDSL